MRRSVAIVSVVILGWGLSAAGQTQQTPTGQPAIARPQGRSAGGDVGSGAGDIGKGTAKGAGVSGRVLWIL